MLSKRQRQRHPGDKVDLENDGSTRSTDWQEACPLARMRHGLVGHVALNKGMQTTGENNIDGNPGSYHSLLRTFHRKLASHATKTVSDAQLREID
jgi:hypothetical protein